MTPSRAGTQRGTIWSSCETRAEEQVSTRNQFAVGGPNWANPSGYHFSPRPDHRTLSRLVERLPLKHFFLRRGVEKSKRSTFVTFFCNPTAKNRQFSEISRKHRIGRRARVDEVLKGSESSGNFRQKHQKAGVKQALYR